MGHRGVAKTVLAEHALAKCSASYGKASQGVPSIGSVSLVALRWCSNSASWNAARGTHPSLQLQHCRQLAW
jgi:hypothetical protein